MLSKKLNDSFEMPIDIKVNQLEEDEAQINIGKLVDKETVKKNPFDDAEKIKTHRPRRNSLSIT